MTKKKLLTIAGLVLAVIVVTGAALFLTQPQEGDGEVWCEFSGSVIDKDTGATDNFKNGKATINAVVVADDFDDVLDPNNPLEIDGIRGSEKMWDVPTINLRESSGKTEANYGENIECDGVLAGPENSGDNLYIKISVPTTLGGDVENGMSIKIEMWPTDDPVEAIDGTISPANFDNFSTYDWWDENDGINITINTKLDNFSQFGFYAVRLIGEQIDE